MIPSLIPKMALSLSPTAAISIPMLLCFFGLMIGVGLACRKHSTNVDGFVLGGRSVGPWLTAFAFGTSYFSAVIFVGFDPEITGEKTYTTCEMLTKHDIPYYATNPDWVCPVEFGYIPDCGSMCQGYERATGKKPVFIGKPEPTMIFEVMKKFGVIAKDTVVIGDRLYTDIASGKNAGVDTVCVLSGEVTLEDVEKSNDSLKPTYLLNHITEIIV